MAGQVIAVIGAGLMGHGIAYLLARAGHRIIVQDPSEDARKSVPDRHAAIAALLGENPLPQESVTTTADLNKAVAQAAYIFEAAPEKIPLKQALFAEMQRIAPPDCIFCSNTSAIPISIVAAKMVDRTRAVGTHFWNPPHLVPLVEVVQIAPENAEPVDKVIALLRAAGRHPVHVRRDIPGFIGNRLQHAMKREAIALVAAGVCDAETVDDVVKFGFGRRMSALGPMEQSDLVGLDLTLDIHETLIPDIDRMAGPNDLLKQKVSEGKFGMATGEGFLKWTPEKAEEVRKRLRDTLVRGLKDEP